MRIHSAFFAVALLSSIIIAADIHEQSFDMKSSTEKETDDIRGEIISMAPLSKGFMFEANLEQFLQRAKRLAWILFDSSNADVMSKWFRRDVSELKTSAEGKSLSEELSQKMSLAEHIDSVVCVAARDIKPYVYSVDSSARIICSLIAVKVRALALQSAPDVVSLNQVELNTLISEISNDVIQAKKQFAHLINVSAKARTQYEFHLAEANRIIDILYNQIETAAVV